MLRRLGISFVVVLGITLLVFLVMNVIPGDPVRLMMGRYMEQTAYTAIRIELGLDQPWWQRYLLFLRQLASLDLGRSFVQHREVTSVIRDAFPVTLRLGVTGIAMALLIGIPAGVLAAVRKNTLVDRGVNLFSYLGISAPAFLLGLLLQMFFALTLGILPVSGIGDGGWVYYFLPGLAVALPCAAVYARMMRASMLEVLQQNYMLAATGYGLPPRRVIWRHGFKNAVLPLVTQGGMDLAGLLGGAVITETVFNLPGLGRVILTAVMQRDYPVVQGGVLVLAAAFVTVNLLVDLFYAWLDPRIRY
jgi:peptide/nickel transport system permease protein